MEEAEEDVEELRDVRGGADAGGDGGRGLCLFEVGGGGAASTVVVEVIVDVVEEEVRRTTDALKSSSSLTSMLRFFPAVARPAGGELEVEVRGEVEVRTAEAACS